MFDKKAILTGTGQRAALEISLKAHQLSPNSAKH